MKNKWAVVCVGIVALATIEVVALFNGIDGVLLGSTATGIGTMVGFALRGKS